MVGARQEPKFWILMVDMHQKLSDQRLMGIRIGLQESQSKFEGALLESCDLRALKFGFAQILYFSSLFA